MKIHHSQTWLLVSNLIISLHGELIVGDVDIHFDKPEGSLRTALVSILDSVGVYQHQI